MDNILEVSGLNKRYGDFALKDISFYLPDGCITGFVGINGAGKTTTLRSILGLTNKVSGNIKFFGMDMDGNESKIKDRIGIVLDEGCFYDELTLSEMKNVIAPAYRNWREQDFTDYMEQFSLNPKQKINTLSKGMRMKYALALALSHKAELLIMDEPTSGLDPLVRSQILNILKDKSLQNARLKSPQQADTTCLCQEAPGAAKPFLQKHFLQFCLRLQKMKPLKMPAKWSI